ncbi:DUF3558 domain-containing protein [Crossiella sp. CA198]|uniref:DUF3558 domain-containing protein n=1 Tax=Crossiella sp. CA198 TaxID=3455607 RepID=UPI003F8D7DAF
MSGGTFGAKRGRAGMALLRSGIAVGMAVVLSGCGITVWYPNPTTTSVSSTTSAPPAPATPPPVGRPKQLREVPPCSLLTKAQQTELGIDTDEFESNYPVENSGRCSWLGFDKGKVALADLRVTKRYKDAGLDQLYRRRSEFPAFTSATVDGYPAVRTKDDKDSCMLHVGVGDEQSFEVNLLAVDLAKPLYPNACEYAEAIARAVLRNIPEAR